MAPNKCACKLYLAVNLATNIWLRAIPDQRLVAGCWLPHWSRRAPAHHTKGCLHTGSLTWRTCSEGRCFRAPDAGSPWRSGKCGPLQIGICHMFAKCKCPGSERELRRGMLDTSLAAGSFQALALASLAATAEPPVWCRARPKSPVAAPTGRLNLACTACQPPAGLARP